MYRKCQNIFHFYVFNILTPFILKKERKSKKKNFSTVIHCSCVALERSGLIFNQFFFLYQWHIKLYFIQMVHLIDCKFSVPSQTIIASDYIYI